MSPAVLQRVCHGPDFRTANSPAALSKLTSTPAILHGFRRHRVIGVDYPAILHCEASTVRGTLVQGLNDGDIWRLDVFEGTEYHREKATVRQILPAKEGENGAELIPMGEEAETRLGEEVECWVYVWIASREGLQEEEWDFEEFVREKMWRWVGDRAEAEGEYEGRFRAGVGGDLGALLIIMQKSTLFRPKGIPREGGDRMGMLTGHLKRQRTERNRDTQFQLLLPRRCRDRYLHLFDGVVSEDRS